ncbi:hypothetical protein MTP99_004502 [Tenebrio molitor]|nr:hypothetical protein MTP99_004502 [Tenebrio molitor]
MSSPTGTTPAAINLGYEFENLVPAYISLLLLKKSDIINFTIETNRQSYRKFDDLIITITGTNGEKKIYAFQLKHKQKGNDILQATILNKPDKHFGLSKYIESYNKLTKKKKKENCVFVLYTNASFQGMNQIIRYIPLPLNASSVFNTTDPEKVFQFRDPKNKSSKEFLQKFYLFSSQKNFEELRAAIGEKLQNEFHASDENIISFINFFRELRLGNYSSCKVTRDMLVLQLLNVFLLPLVIPTQMSKSHNDKVELVEMAIRQFDVAVVKNLDKGFIKDKWRSRPPSEELLLTIANSKKGEEPCQDIARRNKLLAKNDKLSDKVRQQVFWYFCEKPIFIEMSKDAHQVVCSLISLCQNMRYKIKFVLVGIDVNLNFKNCKVFQNLEDLKNVNQESFETILRKFKLSIQGKEPVSIQEFVNFVGPRIFKFITTTELMKLAKENMTVGAKLEELPQSHLHRILLTTVFGHELIKQVVQQSVVIVNCADEVNEVKALFKTVGMDSRLVEMSTYLKVSSIDNKPVLILNSKTICDEKIYEEICSKNRSVYQFRWTKQKFELVSSKNNPKLLRETKFQERLAINDTDVSFDNKLNAICANPGIGKTKMMAFLARHYPSDYWIVNVVLKELNVFFRRKKTLPELLNKFLDIKPDHRTMEDKIKDVFKNQKKIVFLFDGLDELHQNSLKWAIKAIRKLINEGYIIWVSSRPNLKNILENDLKVCTIFDIKEFEREDQEKYIQKRLEEAEKEEKLIERAMKVIFSGTSTTNKNNILGVPLQLYIITEVLIEDEDFKNLDKLLVVTYMYDRFFQEKYHRELKKITYNILESGHDFLDALRDYYFEQYQIGALRSCLEASHFKELNVKNSKKFLNHLKKCGDSIGIVMKVNEDDTFIFAHHTFGEYLSALWLYEYYEEIPLESRKFIFEPQYRSLRSLFDLKLAESCPLHLAVLNQDVHKVKKLVKTRVNDVDKAGRTALHLAASWGKEHPLLIVDKLDSQDKIERNLENEEILNILLNSKGVDLSRKDKLVEWTPLQYADASLSLSSVDKLCETVNCQRNSLLNYQNTFTSLYYCITCGYVNLFNVFLPNILKVRLQDSGLEVSIETEETTQKLLVKGQINQDSISFEEEEISEEIVVKGHVHILKMLMDLSET